MASILNPEERERKRARKEAAPSPSPSPIWRSEAEQTRYSTRLIEALRRVRQAPSAAPPRSRLVREAADRALAAAARGRTRWSRAILSSRAQKAKPSGRRPAAPAPRLSAGGAKAPAVERKAKALARLVPGCRKLAFPAILEEATDYIAAMQMQVRVLTALTQILDGAARPVPSP